jgi:hypothetical protein
MSAINNELVNRHQFKTRNEAGLAVFGFIVGFNNPHLPHSSLGYHSPMDHEKM